MFATQRYIVTTTDGKTIEACCGPAVVKIANVKTFTPIGPEKRDVCCHVGHEADLCRMQTAKVRATLWY